MHGMNELTYLNGVEGHIGVGGDEASLTHRCPKKTAWTAINRRFFALDTRGGRTRGMVTRESF